MPPSVRLRSLPTCPSSSERRLDLRRLDVALTVEAGLEDEDCGRRQFEPRRLAVDRWAACTEQEHEQLRVVLADVADEIAALVDRLLPSLEGTTARLVLE